MKKLSKRLLSLMLAVIMAMPVILAMPSTASADSNINSHLIAQYFTDSDLTTNKVANQYSLETIEGGMTWDAIACKFPGGSPKPYYRAALSSMLSSVDFENDGLTVSFTGKRGGSDWFRYFELSTDSGFTNNGSSSYLYFATNGNAKVRYNGGGETGNAGTGDDGNWHTWVVTIKKGSFTVYKDGAAVGTINDSKVSTDWFNDIKNNGYLLLGASSYSADPAFNGYLRDFRVYDTYIDSSEIGNISGGTSELSLLGKGMISSGSDRWNSGNFNIVSDNGTGNTAVGLWRYDISSLPSVGSVSFGYANISISDVSSASVAGMQVDFYCINGDSSTYNQYTDGTNHNNIGWGSGASGLANYKSNLGLNADNYFGTVLHQNLSSGSSFNLDLTESLITARENGWSSIIIVGIQRNSTSNGSPAWSDTKFYEPYLMASITEPSSSGTYEELTAAISDYEAKMQNAPYTNMQKAYDAYVVANRYADAIYYGGANPGTSAVQNVTNSLIVATENMKPWTYRTGDMSVSTDGTVYKTDMVKNVSTGGSGGVKKSNYSDYMENVLYALGVGEQSEHGDLGQVKSLTARATIAMNYGPMVLLYDGITTPSMPINVKAWYGTWGDDWTGVYIDGTAGLTLGDCWHGRMGSRAYSTSYNYSYHTERSSSDQPGDNTNSTYYYTTTMYYTDGGSGFSNYLRTFDSVTWSAQNGNSKYGVYGKTYNSHIYIIDYKSLRDKIAAKVSTIQNVSAYKEGGMSSLLGYMDNAVDLDPNDYAYNFTGTVKTPTELNGPSTCANDIGSRVSELNSASATADNGTYNNLRAELRTAHNTAPTNNSAKTDMDNYWGLRSNYTALSVDNFFQAYYHAASEHMAGLTSNAYNSSSASPLLANLKTYHHALKPQASFDELDNAYDTAVALSNNESEMVKYTTSSVARFKAYLNNEIADDKIPYEKTKGTSSSYTTYDGQNKTPVNARQLISEDDQSAIDSEKTKIEGASGRYLERRADFSALDSAKNYISNYITTYGADYTTSSKTALTNKINSVSEFPLENAADRADTGVSQNAAIDAETAKYQAINAASELDPLANLKYFDAEYDKANTFLMNLNGKAAEYTASSIQAVIDAVQAAAVSGEGHANKSASTIANAGAVDRADFGRAVQTDANSFAADIKTAMDNLETIKDVESSGIDTSAYEEAVVKINTLDPDAYTIGESILTARSNINAVMGSKEATSTKTYTADGKTSSIQVLNSAINIEGAESQADVDALITTTLTAINSSIRTYPVTKHNAGSQAFTISAQNGTYENGEATYGTTIVASVDDGTEAAWYLEIETASMHKELAFAGYGVRFKTNVLGATTLKAVKRGDGEKRVKILRKYGDNEITDKSPVQLVEFTSGDYTLPAAPSMTGYTFYKYIYDGNEYDAGDTVTGISEDVEIYACYNQKDGAEKYMVSAYDATGETVGIIDMLFKSYNDKVEFTCNGAAGWLESIDGTNYRPFAKGSKVSFFVTEKISLKAVDAETFAQYSLPAVNLRKDGVQDNDSKKVFNAQIVNDGKEIQEYGILIAAPYGNTPIDMNNLVQSMVVVENSGRHDGENGYQILRAKSTKLVGAGQFTISVKSLPENYIYRGYAIYKDSDGNLQTVYSEAMR